MIIAGIDEAGYGPLLGPLVVSAAALEVVGAPVPDDPQALPCLWQLLKAAVAKKSPPRKGRLLIADSKVVHNLTDGNKLLERGVLAFFRMMDSAAGGGGGSGEGALTVSTLLEKLSCTNHELTTQPWYDPQNLPLPWLTDPGDLAIASNMLAAAMSAANVRMRLLRTALISECLYNRLVATTNNKASALVSITLTHLYHLHNAFGHEGLVVGIDKQGGRDHYTSLLLRSFPEAQLKVIHESAEASSYLLTEPSPAGTRRTLVEFREKGESRYLPTALASMLCKYLRELCMHSFNTWWCRQIAGLQPTAGYHQDGTRWLLDVEPHLSRLGIHREMLVRSR
jgi:hypothetical protein